MDFTLDYPTSRNLEPVTRFGGWYIPPRRPQLRLEVNGAPAYSLLHGSPRDDVRAFRPDKDNARESGFFGDFVLPPSLAAGETFELSITDRSDAKNPVVLFSDRFTAAPLPRRKDRDRSYDLASILACPFCGDPTHVRGSRVVCDRGGHSAPLILGVPHFLDPDDAPLLRLTEQLQTHTYGASSREVIERAGSGGLVLDFGAGNTPIDCLMPNVVHLDIQQYPNTDVVAMLPRLPFGDNTFDGIVSQAVFEHLADPHGMARELYRVVKPGGIVYIDTAFMQPLHGDPSHYFNMTLHGLRRVMHGFEEVRSGTAWYQNPSFGMIMQIEQVLPVTAPGAWRSRLEQALYVLRTEGSALDKALGEKGRRTLAAGYFFEGRKPGPD